VFTTDNATETFTGPDGGNTPFKGQKDTIYEGGFRAPEWFAGPVTSMRAPLSTALERAGGN